MLEKIESVKEVKEKHYVVDGEIFDVVVNLIKTKLTPKKFQVLEILLENGGLVSLQDVCSKMGIASELLSYHINSNSIINSPGLVDLKLVIKENIGRFNKKGIRISEFGKLILDHKNVGE